VEYGDTDIVGAEDGPMQSSSPVVGFRVINPHCADAVLASAAKTSTAIKRMRMLFFLLWFCLTLNLAVHWVVSISLVYDEQMVHPTDIGALLANRIGRSPLALRFRFSEYRFRLRTPEPSP